MPSLSATNFEHKPLPGSTWIQLLKIQRKLKNGCLSCREALGRGREGGFNPPLGMRRTGALEVNSDEQMDTTKFGSMTELARLFGLQERQHDMLLCVRMITSSLPLATVLLCLVSLGISSAFRSIYSQDQAQVDADGY